MTIPVPDGCSLMPFQKEGIIWAISKMRGEAHVPSSSVLIADEMGLLPRKNSSSPWYSKLPPVAKGFGYLPRLS